MSQSIAIVGAGLIGRILAFELLKEGCKVSIFDRDSELGSKSCAWTGAGMLAPYAELDAADELVFSLGVASLPLWQELIQALPERVFFQRSGTLVVAHSQDRAEFVRFQRSIECKLSTIGSLVENVHTNLEVLEANGIGNLEPELSNRFSAGLFLREEGQIDNRQLLYALGTALKSKSVTWHTNVDVSTVQPYSISTSSGSFKFDQVVDCRGLGAKVDLPKLRGVRGEIIRIHAPEVSLGRPIRLMHPRYPLYIAPREEGRFVVGATQIESEDMSAMTVQSALELLSAAFSVHPGFANASILEMEANCRPAFPDNVPRIFSQPGLLRINGLYRHGFLVGPKLAKLARAIIFGEPVSAGFEAVLVEEKEKIASSR
jgi:glycine oxidase